MTDDISRELNTREQIARIDRSMAEYHKFAAEEEKLRAEAHKFYTEERKLNRERWWFPWLQLITTVGGSALIAAIVAKLL
jgi:hypothetical protein